MVREIRDKPSLATGLIVALFVIFLIFACSTLGVLTYVPENEVSAGFKQIFGTFRMSANAIILSIAGSVLLALVGALILTAWYGLTTTSSRWFQVQKTRAEAIEAHNRARLAEARIDGFPAGHQIVVTKPADSSLIQDLAHLSPGRLNGKVVIHTEEERGYWERFQAHYGNKPAQHPLMEQQYQQLPASVDVELPNMVRWFDVIPNQRGDMHNLVLGMRVNEAGQLEPVTISLYDLFHTLAAASSGWGKSAFVCSILAQLATCRDKVEFVLVDQQMHGLAGFKDCDRLRYSILRQKGEILTALRETYDEAVGERSELLAKYDADDLEEYNRLSGDYLPPVVVAVDEASALLVDKEIGIELKRQSWELRKFGIYQILALTSAKGTVIDTDHRQQFSSKVQLHANDKGQARLLMDAVEAVSFPAGRAVIDVAGKTPAVVQTPYIHKREIRSLLRPASERPSPPGAYQLEPDENERRVLELHAEGKSISAVARDAFGDDGGNQLKKVRETLAKFGVTDAP